MTPGSVTNPAPIFQGGKLKSGIYKIQNIQSETYVDIEVHTRTTCCRPAKNLGEGRGFWEIKSSGAGYTVQAVEAEPGKPQQFCIPALGSGDAQLTIAPYPISWRIEVVDDVKYRGSEYVRFFWGTTGFVWSLQGGSKANGTTMWVVEDDSKLPQRIWKLIPVKVEGPPLYNRYPTGQSSVHGQVADPDRDDFRTIVTEVTTVTTTTRKRYLVEDA